MKRFSLFLIAVGLLCIFRGQLLIAEDTDWKQLMRQADSLSRIPQFSQAAETAKRALEIAKSLFGPSDTTLAKISRDIAIYLANDGNYKLADSFLTAAIAVYSKKLPPHHGLLIDVMETRANIMLYQGMWLDASNLLKESLAALDSSHAERDQRYSNLMLNLVMSYSQMGSYNEADSLLREIIAIQQSLDSSDANAIANTYLLRTEIFRQKGDFGRASESADEAIKFITKFENPSQQTLSYALSTRASLAFDFGQFVQAESLYTVALNLLDTAIEANTPNKIAAQHNLAISYLYTGDYFNAEDMLLSVRESILKSYDSNYFQLADIATSLGTLYELLGQYSESESWLREAIRVRTRNQESGNNDLVMQYSNLGYVLLENGKFSAADSLFSSSLALCDSLFGKNHSNSILPLENLGMSCFKQGKLVDAEHFLNRALEASSNTTSPNPPARARVTFELGRVLAELGKYKDAIQFVLQSHMQIDSLYKWPTPDRAQCLEAGCDIFRVRGMDSAALSWGSAAYHEWRSLLTEHASFLSEGDALKYANFARQAANRCMSIGKDFDNKIGIKDKRLLAQIALTSKAFVTDIMIARAKQLSMPSDSTLRIQLNNYNQAKSALANSFSLSVGGIIGESQKRELDSLQAIVDHLENDLSRSTFRFRDNTLGHEYSLDSIAASLPSGASLIDYTLSDYLDRSGHFVEQRYLATVVNGEGHIGIMELGAGAGIDREIAHYQSHMFKVANGGSLPTRGDVAICDSVARPIYRKLLKPLRDVIAASKELFIVPDGRIHSISFDGIKCDNSRYLVEDVKVSYLGAATDLLRFSGWSGNNLGLLLVGDLDYGDESASGENLTRSVPCISKEVFSVKRLSNTKSEIEHIRKSWKGSGSDSVVEVTGLDASEEKLRELCRGKRVIHFATHGFFFSDSCFSGSVAETKRLHLNPLLYSGLLVSNCNQRVKEKGSHSDGILTALEASTFDLNGTETVVLSACESGLGVSSRGEGVIGLRRAFQVAGARAVVSSLWPINDFFMSQMMGHLHDDLTVSTADRIRNAELEQLRKLRNGLGIDHPVLWAPFAVTGR